jgi:hypothetical protein
LVLDNRSRGDLRHIAATLNIPLKSRPGGASFSGAAFFLGVMGDE